MPNVRLAMILIRDILRLKYESGLSHRQIAAALHISVGSVTNYLADCASAGLVFPLADKLTDEPLTERLAKNNAKVSLSPQFALPDFAVLHEQLKLKGVTRQLLMGGICRRLSSLSLPLHAVLLLLPEAAAETQSQSPAVLYGGREDVR